MWAIGAPAQNTPSRQPHDRSVERSARVRTCPHSPALERPSSQPPSQGLCRISVRVVNFATSSLEDEGHARLGSDVGDERVGEGDDDGVEKVSEPLPDTCA